MSEGPRFTSVAGARVGYQTHGDGDLDVVYSPGMASHLDMTLEQPRYRRYVERLARYGRVIRFDRRGTGISDPAPEGSAESWELWADDLGAVLDDAGSAQAAIIATNDAGGAAMLFAATHPERVSALVLFNTTARFATAPDYTEGHPPEAAAAVSQMVRSTWGTEEAAALLAPSLVADEPFRRWYARFTRAANSPTTVAADLGRILRMDARHVLGEIQCPVLVIHRADYTLIPSAQARYVAAHCPRGTYVEVPGSDAPIYTQGTDELVDRIGAFLGRNPQPEPDDRLFSTVLFSDIVSSTERAAAVGDRAWHVVLDEHDAAVRAAVHRHGGRFIKSTGDGALATFDAPSRAVQCARAIQDAVRGVGLDLRVGLHAGPTVIRQDGDVGGLAVHAAARVMAQAGAGEIWASGTVAGLVTDANVYFAERGSFVLRGVPDPHVLYSVTVGER